MSATRVNLSHASAIVHYYRSRYQTQTPGVAAFEDIGPEGNRRDP